MGSLIISIYDSICFLDSPRQDVGTKSVKMHSDIPLGNEKDFENPWIRSGDIQVVKPERLAINCIQPRALTIRPRAQLLLEAREE